ncbi:MAG: methionyl-tRNA formyltransferase, partial [Chloroflexota bacterium]
MGSATTLTPRPATGQRVLYLGTRGRFSVPPLEALLAARVPVAAVLLPGPPNRPIHDMRVSFGRPALPLLAPLARDILTLAWQHGIPALEVGQPGAAAALARVQELRASVMATACFPWRLPAAFRQLVPSGALNVHPSLLPHGRGPDPLFWAFRHGLRETGVTVHLMDDHLDTGPILRQRRLPMRLGLTVDELEATCATVGGELLLQALDALAAGTAYRTAQDERQSTYDAAPAAADMEVPTNVSAQQAFTFVRGTVARYPLTVTHEGQRWPVVSADRYDMQADVRVPWRWEQHLV